LTTFQVELVYPRGTSRVVNDICIVGLKRPTDWVMSLTFPAKSVRSQILPDNLQKLSLSLYG
jgi:hypothetical protein